MRPLQHIQQARDCYSELARLYESLPEVQDFYQQQADILGWVLECGEPGVPGTIVKQPDERPVITTYTRDYSKIAERIIKCHDPKFDKNTAAGEIVLRGCVTILREELRP